MSRLAEPTTHLAMPARAFAVPGHSTMVVCEWLRMVERLDGSA